MVRPSWQRLLQGSPWWLGLPALVTLVGLLPGKLISHSSLLLLYLCAVLFTSLRADQRAVMACALISLLSFNFFHTQPRFSLMIQAPDEVLAAAIFMIFALLAGRVAGKLNHQLTKLREQKEFFGAQVQLNQSLHDTQDEKAIPALMNNIFGGLFGNRIHFSLGPLPSATRAQAACELQWTSNAFAPVDTDHEAMLQSLKEQVQNILNSMQAARILKDAERKSDEERLRSALLSSVSHDLKTPLVTMLGAATSLRDLHEDLSASDSAELLDAIISESQRLESYIQNLLDMTRLGHGKLALSRDWVSAEEIYHVVEKRIARLLPSHRMVYRQTSDIPIMYVHAALIEQALFNAIDNSLKAGGIIEELLVTASWHNATVTILVCDHGPGLPVSEWEAVFDQFYTFSLGDCYEKGTGLGLSICRSIFRVHGGEARIVPPPAGFSHCLELTLPAPRISMEESSGEYD